MPSERRARSLLYAFDRKWGTDTTGVVKRRDLDFPPEQADRFHQYEVSGTDALATVLGLLNTAPGEFTFVDVGSGKGRVVLEASQVPFRRCIGIEYSTKLHEIALANARLFTEHGGPCVEPEFWQGDARDYPLPSGPLLLYLYNPFFPPVLGEFLDRVEQSVAEGPREVYLAYVNPEHIESFDTRVGWRQIAEVPNVVLLKLVQQAAAACGLRGRALSNRRSQQQSSQGGNRENPHD
ncbi:class I SAM-dependent methyltransferase [Citromicrobium bathyomarinum]